ncbi:ABC transporter permease [Candidatus Lokiarchaeum ossiferum]
MASNLSANDHNSYDQNTSSSLDIESTLLIKEVEKKKSVVGYFTEFFSNSYVKFILKKAVFYLFVFWITVSIAFLIPRLLPGDPLAKLLRPPQGMVTPEALAAWDVRKHEMESYLNLDKSLFMQYLLFWRDFFQGNLGFSYNKELTPVTEVIGPRLIYSLLVVIPVVAGSFLIGNNVGAWAGYRQSKFSMRIYYLFVFLQSAPYFWTAYIFQYIFITKGPIPLTPPSITTPFVDTLGMYFMIIVLLTLCFSGGWATGARSMMIYETESDYILYCRKLGFEDSKLRKYALRNAMLPQLTGLNLRFNECLGATFIIEYVFAWPGLGALSINAMSSLNYTLMVGTFVVNIIIVVFGNFLIDILYGFIDPRIRITGGND